MGLFFVDYELYQDRKAEVKQFQFDTFRMFEIDLRRDRITISQLLMDSNEEIIGKVCSDLEKFHAFKNILDFYTLLASAAKDNPINSDKALRY